MFHMKHFEYTKPKSFTWNIANLCLTYKSVDIIKSDPFMKSKIDSVADKPRSRPD